MKKGIFHFSFLKIIVCSIFEMHFEWNAVWWKIIIFILLISLSKNCEARNIFYLCIKMGVFILMYQLHSWYKILFKFKSLCKQWKGFRKYDREVKCEQNISLKVNKCLKLIPATVFCVYKKTSTWCRITKIKMLFYEDINPLRFPFQHYESLWYVVLQNYITWNIQKTQNLNFTNRIHLKERI